MRILFITNHYPPFEIGGYEQLCRDVAGRMLARGHEIRVLTSDYGVGSQMYSDPPYVYRDLRLHIAFGVPMKVPMQFLWRRPRAEAQDLRSLHAHVAEFDPDTILFWNLEGLPRRLASAAELLNQVGVAYWVAGRMPSEPDEYWLYWAAQGRTHSAEVFKSLMRKPALAAMRWMGYPVRPTMRHAAVVSEYMRQKGIAEGTLPACTASSITVWKSSNSCARRLPTSQVT